jgi:hypothetical protein
MEIDQRNINEQGVPKVKAVILFLYRIERRIDSFLDSLRGSISDKNP